MKCYRCFTTKDWDECKDIQEEFECPGELDLCYKRYFDGQEGNIQAKFYSKGCTSSKTECKDLNEDLYNVEKFGSGTDCKIDICKGNLCNAAAVPAVSCFILIACACLAFLY